LIDYVNKPAPRVLLLGKPRAGKTTLAASLAKKLDLMHISVENWMSALETKIAAFEPPEDPPEEPDEDYVPPPPYYTDLEDRIVKRLQRGKGPTHLHSVLALKQEMNSQLAKTKGYVLDLQYYRIPVDEDETDEDAAKEEEAPEGDMEGMDGEMEGMEGVDGEEAKGAEDAKEAESEAAKEGGELEAMRSAPEQADTWMKVIRNFKLLGEDAGVGG